MTSKVITMIQIIINIHIPIMKRNGLEALNFQHKMKTTKFRIWNGMEMVYDIVTGKFGTFYVNPENGDGLNPKDTACLSENTTKYFEGIPLMQFTGLYDKNGKEIYESDILKAIPSNILGIVNWCDSMALFELSVMVNNEQGTISIYSHQDSLNNTRREIVGNIYETPELLR